MPSEKAVSLAAGAWTRPETQHIQMDTKLATAFATIIDELIESKRASAEQIARARAAYQTEDIEIDDNAFVSPTDEGDWISAWVWLHK